MLHAPLLAFVSLVATVGAGECRPPKDSSEAKPRWVQQVDATLREGTSLREHDHESSWTAGAE